MAQPAMSTSPVYSQGSHRQCWWVAGWEWDGKTSSTRILMTYIWPQNMAPYMASKYSSIYSVNIQLCIWLHVQLQNTAPYMAPKYGSVYSSKIHCCIQLQNMTPYSKIQYCIQFQNTAPYMVPYMDPHTAPNYSVIYGSKI